MGDDTALETRMETVAQRVEFIELLADEGPLPPRDIVDALSHSRATVTRALRELREANLVEKHEGDYGPTLAGKMAADQYRQYQRASEAVLSVDSLLGPIPGAHAPPVEILVDAETILAEGEIPVRALEAVSDRVQRADTVEVYLPTLVNTHLLRVWHRAVMAGSVGSVALFDPDLLTVLKGQYPHLLAEMASADGFDAYSTPGPPYGLVLTTIDGTTSVAVIVYEDDTKVRGVLTNDAAAAVDWVAERLERLRIESNVVTGELEALSDAVADGVAPLRSPPAGTIRSVGSGETPTAMAAEGHDLPIDLEAEGFVRLSETYFESHGLAEPTVSWRTGFTLAEVHGGHSVDRLDVKGRNFTDRLVEDLKTGTDHVVLGPPGSGKSTVCMAVACEWYDRRLGPVLYRERGGGDLFESTALLEAYLRQTGGHALVVLEDAVRDDANRIFEVMQSLDADPSVTFLLDSRSHEWRAPDGVDLDARREAYRRTAVETIDVPGLDEAECDRFVEHFEQLVGAKLDLTGADLYELIEGVSANADGEGVPAGDALLAQHHLARRHDSPLTGDAAASALDEAVRDTYRTIADAGVGYGTDLAVMVALLTAAGIPVAREYLYALADSDEFDVIEEAASLLEGRLLFEPDRRLATATTYRTPHETWAIGFLNAVRTIEPTDRACERFGRCVTRLLALADAPERRERIRRHLGGRTPHIHRIEADPRGWADELAERVFGLGRADASLAPLFGETDHGAIELPEASSGWTRLQQAYWRGEMNRTHGDLSRAEREYRTLESMARDLELSTGGAETPATPDFVSARALATDDLKSHRTRWRATSRTNLGVIASDRGQLDTAREHIEAALALFREIDDREGEATCLKHLGQVAFYASDYDRARESFEEGLAIARNLEARLIEFGCLMDLGAVTVRQSDYDRGRDYLEQSLSIARDLGRDREEAQVLNNLGVVATYQGAFDEARDSWEASLAIRRDLGDRQGVADSIDNLGMVARKCGDYDRAEEFHEEALALRRDIGYRSGEATSLVNLGSVARAQGELDRAETQFETALDIFETIGETKGIAEVHLEQGRLALARGAIDEARELAEEARRHFEALTLHIWIARSRRLLGRVAAAAGAPEEAREHCQTALETFKRVGAPPDTLETLATLVERCREQGDGAAAADWCRRAQATLEDAPEPLGDQHRDWVEQQAAELGVT